MRADIELKSIHFEEDGKLEDIISVSGDYLEKGNTRYVKYEHTSEDGDVSYNMIKFDEHTFTHTKKGVAHGIMHFEPGKETKTNYVTPYGTFAMTFDTKEYSVESENDSIKVTLKYDLSINEEKQARCHIFLRLKINNDTMRYV